MARKISTLPVSGSTSTSKIFAAKIGPTPVLLAEAEQVMGPPVRICLPASSLKVSRSEGFLAQMKVPSSNNTSSSWTSQIRAARLAICFFTSSAAAMAAKPVSKAVRLPPVLAVKPTASVSPTVGKTSSAFRPSVSAACIATAVRVPPMSTDPVMRLMVPLLLTLIVAEEVCPPCQRNPTAMPRPRLGPPRGSLKWG